eukprot:TRINITY_DN1819_c0_g1_i1.p1 TRINITY_DN1819_c0_g1~~TRINITY_DN1819_c0_g1_i1.p1  ORF type:complete len:388 (-),score=55.65 TRINITY_DN1819_c0_g1_i1:244-1407(-)
MVAATAWQCSSDASCQLNGQCVAGACQCAPQWLGANCSELNLGESRVAYSGMTSNTSTWGGHPVWHSGKWHGYFAEMTNHCLLDAWTTNSITVHATADSPWGPFTFERVVQPAWSHNPLVSMDVDGTLLIAHIGCGTIAPGHAPRNCSHDSPSAQSSHQPPCECGDRPGGACQTIQVLSARSPSGLYTDRTVAVPLSDPSAWPSCLSNPSLLLPAAAGQPTLLAFNGNLAPPKNHGPSSHPGIAVSMGGWEGPFEFVNQTDAATGKQVHYLEDHGYAEDSVVWRDMQGNTHMLMHGFYDKFPGVHGWSKDGMTGWEFSATPAYGFEASLGGEQITLGQRERPQVVLLNGTIGFLYNGARGPPGGAAHTFNMVTQICANGPARDGMCP